jgi:transposase-like protein
MYGYIMSTILEFHRQYPNEASCIEALAALKWPDGFRCRKCDGTRAYHLTARPKIYKCADCGEQHSVTDGTIFEKTKTDLQKWFFAAFLMARDKRGVSAMFLSHELRVGYKTAWLMAQKLRHGLTGNQDFQLEQFIEIDESFIGGRRQKGNRGRALGPNKTMIVLAVENRVANEHQGKGIKGSGFVAGSARVTVMPAATKENLGRFIRANVKPKTTIISDGFRGYRDLDEFRHIPVVQGAGENAERNQPIVHVLFSNIKGWINGTHHGVSAKHLPRYLREWEYRFNRRQNRAEMADYLLRRAATRETITYDGLVEGDQPEGALEHS